MKYLHMISLMRKCSVSSVVVTFCHNHNFTFELKGFLIGIWFRKAGAGSGNIFEKSRFTNLTKFLLSILPLSIAR